MSYFEDDNEDDNEDFDDDDDDDDETSTAQKDPEDGWPSRRPGRIG